MFWSIFYYALAFLAGWYLYPFDGRVRHAINAMIMKLVNGIIAMIQERQGQTPRKRATARASTASNGNGKTSVSKPLPACPKCHNALQPAGGEFKGYNLCISCNTLFPAK
jgi:hypothetical protein